MSLSNCNIHPYSIHTDGFIQNMLSTNYGLIFCCIHYCIDIKEHGNLCCLHGQKCYRYKQLSGHNLVLFNHHIDPTNYDLVNIASRPEFEISSVSSKEDKRQRRSFHHGVNSPGMFRCFPILRTFNNILLQQNSDLSPLLSKKYFSNCKFCVKSYSNVQKRFIGDKNITSSFHFFNIR